MSALWRRPFPDLTTESIERIDRELAHTEEQREFLSLNAVCVVCGERGFPHIHFLGGN